MVDRRYGIQLDPAQLEFELARRGWQGADLARRAGISEHAVSRGRRGIRVSPDTLSRIVKALAATKPLAGADALVSK